MKIIVPQSFFIFFLWAFLQNVLYSNEIDTTKTSLFDISIEELIQQEVTIATKSNQKLSQTPSVVSVITAEEIKTMGYRDIFEILQTIPGFEVNQTRLGARAIGIRGVNNSRQGGRLLVLLDGLTYNDIMYGTGLFFGSEFNIDAIEKIEVIRGPGSALYGRNAFSGVLNIITKKAQSNNQLEAGASYGSYTTFDGWANYGIKKDKFNANLMAKYYQTESTDSKYNNGEGGESIWNIGHENYFINANAQYKNFQFFGSFTQRNDGTNTATTYGDFITDGSTQFNIGTYSLLYKKDIASNASINVKLYGRNEYRSQEFEYTTPNTTDLYELAGIPFNYIYSQGAYAEPVFDAYTYGGEIEFSIQLAKNNKLLTGVQTDFYGIKNASLRANLDLNSDELNAITNPNTGIQYTKEEMPLYESGWIINNGHEYTNIALYAQDVHYFTDNLSLTLGGRLDFDSEVGKSINPRVGLVWEPTNKSSIKLLYGKAYRAPTTSEQYKILGTDIGNAELKHEVINTTEFVFAYQFDKIYTQTSLFYNILDDLILSQQSEENPALSSYYNSGQNVSYGVEFESKYKLNNKIYSFANYCYTISEDNASGENDKTAHSNISTHKFNIGLNTRVLKKINWSILLLYRGEIQKYLDQELDSTPPYVSQDEVGNFFLLNSTIIYTVFKDFDLSLQGYNLLNTTYYYQDETYEHQPKQPGIHFLLRASYNFNL
jgi:iron complex outermembrane receptor protein